MAHVYVWYPGNQLQQPYWRYHIGYIKNPIGEAVPTLGQKTWNRQMWPRWKRHHGTVARTRERFLWVCLPVCFVVCLCVRLWVIGDRFECLSNESARCQRPSLYIALVRATVSRCRELQPISANGRRFPYRVFNISYMTICNSFNSCYCHVFI